MDLIVDASVGFKWLVKEEGSDSALRLLGNEDIVAPDFLLAECRNAILTSVRRGKLTVEAAQQIERNLDALQIATMPSRPLLSQAFAIGLEYSHPIYDCIYVAAALATNRVLVTADENFAAKFATSAIGRNSIKLLKVIAAGL
jgi:predicted nucleic acid-binding protein